MLKVEMTTLIDMANWYGSLFGNFIHMYNEKKPPHVLPKFSMNKLVMQEMSYHILVALSARLHQKKKAPWPTLPLWIGLYKIQNLKYVDSETEDFKKFTLSS